MISASHRLSLVVAGALLLFAKYQVCTEGLKAFFFFFED